MRSGTWIPAHRTSRRRSSDTTGSDFGHPAPTDGYTCIKGFNRKNAPGAAKQTKPAHKSAGRLLSNMMEGGRFENGPKVASIKLRSGIERWRQRTCKVDHAVKV